MSTTILLAAALQKWERYSAHALAARDVAATLAKGTAHHLHVVSVYDYPPLNVGYIPAEVASRLPSSPEHKPKAFLHNAQWWADNRSKVSELWSQWLLQKG